MNCVKILWPQLIHLLPEHKPTPFILQEENVRYKAQNAKIYFFALLTKYFITFLKLLRTVGPEKNPFRFTI